MNPSTKMALTSAAQPDWPPNTAARKDPAGQSGVATGEHPVHVGPVRGRPSGHATGWPIARSLHALILQAFWSLRMERGKEKPCSPKGVCYGLLMNIQDRRRHPSEMLSKVRQRETGLTSQDRHIL